MNDTGVIDRFFQVFSRYIDSGFGLLGGEVAFLSTTLVAIDVTLAALFWAWAPGEDVLARLIKKTLYVGFFAFIIGNFHALASIILASFSGLGLKAAGGGLSAEDFLRPGRVAAAGISAAKPMLEAAAELGGFPAFFENIVQVVVLLIGWLLVVVAFFIISVQIFVCILEFKLTTLAGFVLVPFGLFGRTAFLAERMLGNVIAAGVKVLVLAVITGIGSSLFSEFTAAIGPGQPNLETVLALALASLTLLGLSIFGPGIASGLVSGAPQLGAGAAVGTGLMVGGMAMAGAAAAQMAVGGGASLAAAAGAAGGRPGPSGGGVDRLPPPAGPQGSGPHPAPGGGAPGGSPSPKAQGGGPDGSSGGSSGGSSAGASSAAPRGGDWNAGSKNGTDPGPEGGVQGNAPPAWARDLQHRQALAHGAGLALHAAGSGDAHGGGANPSLSEDR
ncbi:P-type conjugative transfer protein TrbL [Caulobacter rhizosphaerae]|jgi:type IV secretion system protein TrbL|uniref:P-type conjugative transfer protein TrbL n=1 Tax=Caulobacter rhizosphaerae TaxID=2010972 RepID=UPI0013D329B3|nr:P-type conjugative transfer protein TrbL [Caulobacter rhizosphaerae]GGL12918.1 conjugal transfer protein TrbL [Caulobacter rhizosphaerae]